MNKCMFIGNLTKDPEIRQTQSGDSVGNFTIAVRRDYDKDNADFFKVTAWKGLADICGKYLKKGSKVAVFGTLQTTSFTDKDGNKKTITEIIAADVEFLSKEVDNKDVPNEKLPF